MTHTTTESDRQPVDVHIIGTGSYLPGDGISFDAIEDVLGTLEHLPEGLAKWEKRMKKTMSRLMGTRKYYYGLDPATREPVEDNTTLSVKALQRAIAAAGIEPESIDLLVWGGVFPDQLCPNQGVFIISALGLKHCIEISLNSNCSAPCKGILIARDLLAAGTVNTAVVVSSQMSSQFLRADVFNPAMTDKHSLLLRWILCDGAGAVVMKRGSDRKGFLVETCYVDYYGTDLEPNMYCLFGSKHSHLPSVWAEGLHHLRQNYTETLALGPEIFFHGVFDMLKRSNMTLRDIDWFIADIISADSFKKGQDWASETLGFPRERALSLACEKGYPGAPIMLTSLDHIARGTIVAPGERVALFETESSKWINAGLILRKSHHDDTTGTSS